MRSTLVKLTTGLVIVAVGFASPAAAASRTVSAASATQSQPAVLSPWVALSALGSSSSSAALCGSAATAAAASSAVQGAAPGCVLPAVDAPPPIAQAPEAVPLAAVPATAAGFSILPLLLGLAGAAAVAALLLAGGDDEDEIDVEPITQG